MQLSPTDPSGETAARRPTPGETGERILALQHELTEVRGRLAGAESEHERARQAKEAAFRREKRELTERGEREDADARASRHERQRVLQERREARRERILRVAGTMHRRLMDELALETRQLEEKRERASERLAGEDSERRTPVEETVRRWEELLPQVRARGEAAELAVRNCAATFGMTLEEPEPWRGGVEADADPDRIGDEARRALEQVIDEAGRASSWWGSSLARSGSLYLYQVLLLVAGGGAAAAAIHFKAGMPGIVGILAGTGIGVGLLRLGAGPVRRRGERRTRRLFETVRSSVARFEAHADAALKHLDALHIALAEELSAKLSNVESRVEQAARERTAPLERRLEELQRRKERAEKRLFARHELRLETLIAEEAEDRRRREEERAAAVEAQDAARREGLTTLDREHAERTRELRERHAAILEAFSRFAETIRADVDGENPPWDGIDPGALELPSGFPSIVPFGRIRVETAALSKHAPAPSGEDRDFDLPVCLDFPERGSLLVRHAGAERDAAIEILTNAVLRLLTTFPPGKARLTIVDPVGLGQSFSALMHLADHDEALVDNRIWTEVSHIEQRLADLTGHIEKVIQKYLRNRFETIAEYNAEAGELQEAYHFLVMADFPTSLSEVAAERLASIVSSGPRCGVYTIMSQDTRLPVPPVIDERLISRNGLVLEPAKDGFRLTKNGLDRAEFVAERPPEATAMISLLDRIGMLSVDADRVEVPFASVAPTDEEMWTGSTDSGVRVSIGRTGAERLQYFDLGRGTAQHALIAGRTGSGKSTLFHVMITNMSLWFSPDEVEFYLIDFKKGVEFKPFATHRLPHARVVAIESDREFGLSVLKAVDAELARRGDLFRALGVQDLAGYRRSGAAETLPRTLVMIDEFQEYFTEDDSVARDAALLLDRFVRQGRAFGIHMVLGSQTLSGIYTLAKSTLGQMGVRISLQCNESDSYLILSEDNGAARLLSRPGDAIYNDMSGLIEGNNPFQVVWLPEKEEAAHLARIGAKSATEPRHPLPEAVVFEGNLPADLEQNETLMAIANGGAGPGDGDDRIWLGEPNAIKGPTEVRFLPASGSNVLIVGQRRDAAFATMAAAVVGLSAQHRPEDVRIVILDGGGHEPEYAEHFDNLLGSVPCRIERYDLRTAADAVASLAREIAEGEAREGGGTATYVFAFGLQRLRMLRRADEFAMPFGDEPAESTGDQFATILTEGPPVNVHTVIWCDTVMNLSRTLDRRTMREFDVRVLFQMSAADSSELIDSTAANLLGLHNALLALESQGTFEKFRPYAIPSGDLMRRIGGGPGTLSDAGAATPLPAVTTDESVGLATGDLPDEPDGAGAP